MGHEILRYAQDDTGRPIRLSKSIFHASTLPAVAPRMTPGDRFVSPGLSNW